MKKFWKSFKSFLKDENGSSFLELAIIIIIMAGLVLGVYAIATSVNEKIEDAGEMVDGITLPIGGTP